MSKRKTNKQIKSMIESITGCQYYTINDNPPHWSSKHKTGYLLRNYRGRPCGIKAN